MTTRALKNQLCRYFSDVIVISSPKTSQDSSILGTSRSKFLPTPVLPTHWFFITIKTICF